MRSKTMSFKWKILGVFFCSLLGLGGCKKEMPAFEKEVNSIKIGEVQTLTGSEAAFGIAIHRGIEIARDHFNEAGGINGLKLEIITLDDQGKSEEAATAVTKLINQHNVLALIFAPFEFGILLISLFSVIPLAGAHAWVHYYYFFGAGLSSLLLLSKLIEETAKKPILQCACLLTLFWGGVYNTRTNIWVIARTPNWWALAKNIRAHLPPDTHLITDDEEDATHLLFLGEPGTIAAHGILDICHQEPYKKRKLALLVTDPTYELSLKHPDSCLKSSQLISIVKSDYAVWRLYLHNPSTTH